MVRDKVTLTGMQLLILSLMVSMTTGRTDTVVSRKSLGSVMGYWNPSRREAAWELVDMGLLIRSYKWGDQQVYYSITEAALCYFPRANTLYSNIEYYQDGML